MTNDFNKLDAQDSISALAKIQANELPAQGTDEADELYRDVTNEAEAELEGTLYAQTDMGRND